MYKVAVLGDRDSIYGFAALGLDTFPITVPEEAGKTIKSLAEHDYAVIYITESLAAGLEAEIEHYRLSLLPAIIPIPGLTGNTGAGIRQVKKMVEQAVGSDIIFGGENEKRR